MGHSRLSPSASSRWVFCPGSITMEARFPETTRSEAAEEGTASHFVGSESLSGRAIPAGGQTAPNGVILTAEMIESAEVYTEAVAAAAPRGTLLQIEKAIRVSRVHADCWGTPDLWYFDPATWALHVWDYKYGFGIVEPFENWQGICYAAGALDIVAANMGHPAGSIDQRVTVVIHIVQPRPFHAAGPAREWRVKASDLRGYINRLEVAAAEALGANPRTVSGDYCRYCSARHACPAAQKAAMFAVDVTDRAVPEELTPAALAIELRTLQRAAKALEYRLTGLESQAIAALQAGGYVPGFGLQSGAGRPAWTVPAPEVFALGELFGLDLRKPPEPITPAQAKKAGLDSAMVAAYSEAKGSGIKLVATGNTLAAQVFKQRA